MPRPAFRCKTDVTIHCLRSSGAWLPNRDDIYVSVELLGKVERTRLLPPLFPAYVNDTLTFERTFWSPMDRLEVIEMLQDLPVSVELRQVTDVYCGGTLLAYTDTDARRLLFPYSPDCGVNSGNEMILSRTIDFPGSSVRLEYSTFTVVEELPTPLLDSYESQAWSKPPPVSTRPSRSRARSRKSGEAAALYQETQLRGRRSASPGMFARKTVSSVLHARSPSPDDRLRSPTRFSYSPMRSISVSKADTRPPFIVKKVSPSLLSRSPVNHEDILSEDRNEGPPRPRSASPTRKTRPEVPSDEKRSSASDDKEEAYTPSRNDFTKKENVLNGTANGNTDRKVSADRFDSSLSSAYREDASNKLVRSSSVYSLHDRYSPVMDSYLDRIKRRVDEAIWRNRYPRPLPLLRGCHDCWCRGGCHHHHRHHHYCSYVY